MQELNIAFGIRRKSWSSVPLKAKTFMIVGMVLSFNMLYEKVQEPLGVTDPKTPSQVNFGFYGEALRTQQPWELK